MATLMIAIEEPTERIGPLEQRKGEFQDAPSDQLKEVSSLSGAVSALNLSVEGTPARSRRVEQPFINRCGEKMMKAVSTCIV